REFSEIRFCHSTIRQARSGPRGWHLSDQRSRARSKLRAGLDRHGDADQPPEVYAALLPADVFRALGQAPQFRAQERNRAPLQEWKRRSAQQRPVRRAKRRFFPWLFFSDE